MAEAEDSDDDIPLFPACLIRMMSHFFLVHFFLVQYYNSILSLPSHRSRHRLWWQIRMMMSFPLIRMTSHSFLVHHSILLLPSHLRW